MAQESGIYLYISSKPLNLRNIYALDFKSSQKIGKSLTIQDETKILIHRFYGKLLRTTLLLKGRSARG
jgi:hypothetical protein